MAGKVATIGDLFSPMQSIQTCMESQGNAINNNLVSINNAVIGCATTLSEAASVIDNSVSSIKSDIISSLKDINNVIEQQTTAVKSVGTGFGGSIGNTLASIKQCTTDTSVMMMEVNKNFAESNKMLKGVADKMVTQNDINAMLKDIKSLMSDQMNAASATTVGMSGSVENAMANVAAGLGQIVSAETYISHQIKNTNRYLFLMWMTIRKISRKGAAPIGTVTDKVVGKAQVAKSKLLDVKGGKNVGDVIRAMAEAAVTISKIPFTKALTLRRKVKGIFDAFFGTIKMHEKDMTPAKMKKYETAVITMRRISDKLHDTANELAGIAVVGVFAKIGSKMAGSIIRNLMLALKPLELNKTLPKTELKVLMLKRIARSLLELNGVMALSLILAPVAIVGTKLTSVVIRSTLLAIRPLGTARNLAKTELAAINLRKIATSILVFEASMSLTTILAPVAMAGVLLSSVLLRTVNLMLRPLGKIRTTKTIIQSALNMAIIGKSLLVFEASMALTSILAPVALVGMGMTALLIKGTQLMFKMMGTKVGTMQIRQGAINMALMTTSILVFTLGVLAATMITKYIITGGTDKIDVMNIFALAGSVGIFYLMVGSYSVFSGLGSGIGSMNVRNASINILLMSAAILAFSISVLVSDMVTKQILGNTLKSGKFDPTDLIGLAGAVGIYALMLGSYWVFRKLGSPRSTKSAFAGFGAIAAMSLGLILFASSIYITHQISKSIIKDWKGGTDWKALVMDIAILGLMLGSMWVYNRLGSPGTVKSVFAGFGSIAAMSLGLVMFSVSLVITDGLVGRLWKTSDGKMDWMALIKTVAVFGLMFGSMYIFKFAGKGDNMKDIMKGAGAVAVMSVALGLFGYGLSFYVKSTENASIGTLLMMPVLIGAFVGEFILAGKFFKDILIGSGAVAVMSIAIGLFGYGVKFYVDAIKDVGWEKVGMMAALVGIFGLEFALIGIPAVAGAVALGSAAITAVSLALYVFGDGVKHYSEAIANVGVDETKKMAMLIGVFGGEFALLGPLSPAILLSDAAFALMGKALVPFSEGVGAYANTLDGKSYDDIKKMASLIGIFAGEFALIAPLMPLITVGSAAIGIMSGALNLLGKSLQEWSKAEMDGDKLDLICVAIDRLKLAFMGDPKGETSGSGGGIGGFFKKVGKAMSGAITGGFELGSVTTTATAIGIISGALSTLGKSLQNWNDVKIDEEKLKLICLSIDNIKLAFQGVPDENQSEKKSFFERMKGRLSGALTASFDMAKVKMTADALSMAGFTIKNLAVGMKEWMGTRIDMDKITSLSEVLICVRDIFSILGDEGQKETDKVEGWLNRKLARFAPSDVEKGVRATKNMGVAMTSIAEGLVKFYDIYGTKFNDTTFMNNFTSAVATTVTSLSKAFKTVGEAYMEQEVTPAAKWDLFGRLWQDLTVNTFGPRTKNAVQEGIKNVKGLGDALKDIAQGLKEFKDTVPTNNSSFVVDVAAGISALLKGIQEPLIAFGTTDESFSTTVKQSSARVMQYGAALSAIDDISAQTMNYEHHKVDVTAALQHIGELGKLVEGLANGAKTLADAKLTKDIGKYGKVDENFNVTGGSGLVGNVQKLLCANIGVFVQLGKKVKEYGMHEIFEDQVVQNVTKGLIRTTTTNTTVRVKKGEESYIGIAVQAAAGIGGVISGLADGYAKMNKNFPTEDKMVEGVSRVAKATSLILNMFSSIGATICVGKYGETYPLITDDPQMNAKYGGRVSGYLHNLYNNNTMGVIEKATKSIEETVSSLSTSFGTLNGQKNIFTGFLKQSRTILDSIMNATSMSYMLCEHAAGDKVPYYSGGKSVGEYTTLPLYTNMLDTAKGNADKISEIASTMTSASATLSSLNVKSSASFVTFANNMVTGINKFAGAKQNIKQSTDFIESLRNAVKEKVFDNISGNTERIANALNSLDNDIMKPYAEMIAGMGKLVEADRSRTSQTLNEIKKTVEEIVEIVNKANPSAGTTSGAAGGDNKPFAKLEHKNPPEQKQQNVNVTTTVDASQFEIAVKQFVDAVYRMTHNIPQ